MYFYLHTYSSVSYKNYLCGYYRQARESHKFLLSFNRPIRLLNTQKNTYTDTSTHTQENASLTLLVKHEVKVLQCPCEAG